MAQSSAARKRHQYAQGSQFDVWGLQSPPIIHNFCLFSMLRGSLSVNGNTRCEHKYQCKKAKIRGPVFMDDIMAVG